MTARRRVARYTDDELTEAGVNALLCEFKSDLRQGVTIALAALAGPTATLAAEKASHGAPFCFAHTDLRSEMDGMRVADGRWAADGFLKRRLHPVAGVGSDEGTQD